MEYKDAGSVFVSYAREELARVTPLVNALTEQGLIVLWDREIKAGDLWRQAIQSMLNEAACVIVVWSKVSVTRQFVLDEASRRQADGIVVPILLDAGTPIPLGFGELQYLDFTRWTPDRPDKDSPEMDSLIKRIRSLVARGPQKVVYGSRLIEDKWVISNSQQSLSGLHNLTLQTRSLSDLLVSDSPAVKDLKGALREVSRTYEVVNSAILSFIAPAANSPIDVKPFLQMERGTLEAEIENGRGHCSLILTHYFRSGGIRDQIKDKPGVQLTQLDDTFAQLGTADGDLFLPLAQIGSVLTTESRTIANLLLAEQEAAARKRILDGRAALAPLEAQLSAAMQELKKIESSLGYAEASRSATEKA
jgi:TIR domain